MVGPPGVYGSLASPGVFLCAVSRLASVRLVGRNAVGITWSLVTLRSMCDLLSDWCDAACERAAWRAMAKEAAEVLNHSLEESEAERRMRGRSKGREKAFQHSHNPVRL